MKWWHRLFRRRKLDEELEKELGFHLEQHTSDLIAQGYSPREARRRARIALGGPEQVKEMCRDARGTRWLSDLVRDVRYGVRVLAKKPSFTVVAALALGLGIGVNTAILSAVNGFILRPLSADRPEELAAPYWGRKTDAEVWERFSYANYVDLREQSKSFTDICAYTWAAAGMSSGESRAATGGERAEVVWGELV
ncbi:MAG TPA: permease prefix domain 1-containing protein, partial [Pyrinomonadaceae bacterium]